MKRSFKPLSDLRLQDAGGLLELLVHWDPKETRAGTGSPGLTERKEIWAVRVNRCTNQNVAPRTFTDLLLYLQHVYLDRRGRQDEEVPLVRLWFNSGWGGFRRKL